MKKILVCGSNGQLGSELQLLSKEYKAEFLFTDIAEMDICNPTSIAKVFKSFKPDIVINAAAYTAVDKAEEEFEKVKKVNVSAVGFLSEACNKSNALLIHISSDYVFDGKNNVPYPEHVSTNPIGVYAKSKRDGEVEILLSNKRALIIRTSWLYSSFGNNFVKTILSKSKEMKELKVVYDQIGTPTYAEDLAKVILQFVDKADHIKEVEVFHYSNEGLCSWFDFAHEIIRQSGTKAKVLPIETKELKLAAPRPAYSVLSKSKVKEFLKIEIPHWSESLSNCLNKLK